MSGDPINVAFLGDSITEGTSYAPGVTYPALVASLLGSGYAVTNYGAGGATTLRSSYPNGPIWDRPQFSALLADTPEIIVVMLGTNDADPAVPSLANYETDLRDLIATLQGISSDPIIVLATPPPLYAVDQPRNDRLNNIIIPTINAVAADLGLQVININAAATDYPSNYPDGIHPNSAGLATLAAAFDDVVEDIVVPSAYDDTQGFRYDTLASALADANAGDHLHLDNGARIGTGVASVTDNNLTIDLGTQGFTVAFSVAASVSSLTLTGSTPTTVTVLGSGGALIIGASANDSITGSGGNDTLAGGDGNDTLNGGAGSDMLFGGAGIDQLIGGDGDDNLYVVGNDSLLQGGNGYDQVIVLDTSGVNIQIGSGVEYVAGNSGADVLNASALSTGLTIGGAGGNDSITGGSGNDVLAGNDGNDTVIGGGGADVVFGGAGVDDLYGGDGDDKLYVLGNDGVLDGGIGYDRVIVLDTSAVSIQIGSGVEYAAGNAGGDIMNASALTTAIEMGGAGGNDILTGGSGNDTVSGGIGADRIFGGAGADLLLGGDGNDTLNGGAGNDTFVGGNGFDTFVFEAGSGNDFVFQFQNGQDVFDFTGHTQVNSISDVGILDSGADAYITLAGGGQIVVFGAAGQIGQSDFLF